MTTQIKYAYAGIGSRETPFEIQAQMTVIATLLSEYGWLLRTGGAEGADSAFIAGCNDRADIYLPWEGFNGRRTIIQPPHFRQSVLPADPDFGIIASRHHPNWAACSPGAKLLHARNVPQVLGPRPRVQAMWSKMVICWTKNAAGGGGTGQALRIARAAGIPIFDLADPTAAGRLQAFLEKIHNDPSAVFNAAPGSAAHSMR